MNLSHLHERIYPNSQVPYLRQFWDHGDVPGPKKKHGAVLNSEKRPHKSRNKFTEFSFIIRKATFKEIEAFTFLQFSWNRQTDRWFVMRWSRDRSWRTTQGARCGVGRVDPTFCKTRVFIATFSLQALYNWIWVMSHEGYSTDWLDWMALLFHFQVYIAILHWRVLTIISEQRIPASSCYFTCSGFCPVVHS